MRWTREEERELVEAINSLGYKIGIRFFKETYNRSITSIYQRISILKKAGVAINGCSTFSNPDNVKYVRDTISKHPENLSLAFEEIAERLNLAKNTIISYWYTANCPINRSTIGTCFMLIGKDGNVYLNSKNK